jgi:hypothetical protein
MMAALARQWLDEFWPVVSARERADRLREAALGNRLDAWTSAATEVVVATSRVLGWDAVAKGSPSSVHPEVREKFVTIDVTAFARTADYPWPFPIAAFELKNSRRDDRVAYSLWKVLCLRAPLRMVFAYRPDADKGVALVADVAVRVIGGMSISDRTSLQGETAIVIGNRSGGEQFPWGYFRTWILNTNTGRFIPA